MKRLIQILIIGALVAFFSTLSSAQVPQMINYQGKLTTNTGAPVNDTLPMVFTIYSDTGGTNPLWTETQTAVEILKGVFNVLLGSVSPIPYSVFDGSNRYLGVKVGGDPEITPRKPMVSVAYAYRAGAGGGGSEGGWTDDGAVVRLTTVSDYVGIGTASPSAKLDVSGDINTNAFYRMGGNIVLQKAGTANIFVGDDAGENNSGSWGAFVGYEAGFANQGNENTFIGSRAGKSNTTGTANTFLGTNAGRGNTTGSSNTFLGKDAGIYNTSGYQNLFLGDGAGYTNATGYKNTFVGWHAGYSDSSGHDNTFVGQEAGKSTTGSLNTFLGRGAGWSNATGFNNTFVGYAAGYLNGSGYDNTFVGLEAGWSNNTGNNNTFLGRQAGYSNSAGTGNVFVGYGAGYNETGSNKLYIANSSADPPLIYGDFSTGRVGFGTTNPTKEMEISKDQNDWTGLRLNNPSGGDLAGSGIEFREGENWRAYIAAANSGNTNALAGPGSLTIGSEGPIRIATSVDPVCIMTGGSNVGIGTSSPGCALHVQSPSSYFGMLRLQNSYTGNNEATMGFIGGSEDGHETWLAGVGAWGTGRNFVIGLNAAKFVITAANGNVGIGTTDPSTYKLAVNGTAAKPGGGSWDNFSDVKLKEVKSPYEYGLLEISKLKPVHYRYKKGNALGLPSDQDFVGLVAQDVQGVIPDAVNENDKGYLMLNNDPIIWAMLNAIKELKAENQTLQQRIQVLEGKVSK